MKYHSPFSTIVISVILVLCFAAVSVFTVLFFGISSPTEIIVQDAIASFSSDNPDITLSYSSIDRRLSEGVTVNDVEVALRGKPLLTVDKVSVEKGIVSIIKELFSDISKLEIKIKNPSIDLGLDDISTIKEILASRNADEPAPIEGETPEKSGKDRKRIVLDLDFSDVNVEFDEIATLPTADMMLRFDSVYGLVSAEADIREVEISYNDINADLTDLKLRCQKQEGKYNLKLSLKNTDVIWNDIEAELSAFAFDTAFTVEDLQDPVHLPFRLGAVALEGEKTDDDVYLKSMPFSLTSDGRNITTGFNQIYASYGRYALSLDSFSVGLDLDEEIAKASIDDMTVYDETLVLGKLEELGVLINKDGVVLDLETISSDYIDTISKGYFEDVNLSGLKVDLKPIGNGGNIRLGAKLALESSNELIDNLSADIAVNLHFEDKNIRKGTVEISSIQNEKFRQPLRLLAGYNGDLITLDVDYGKKNMIAINYGEDLDFNFKLDEFHITDAIPFIDVLMPEAKNYIAEDTILNGRLGFTANIDENAKLGITGPMEFAFALGGVNFNSMKFNVGTTLSGYVDKNNVDIDSFILTSDYIKLRYSGMLDLEDYLPEGTLRLETSQAGSEILSLMLDLNENRNYAFNLAIPMLGDTTLEGKLDFDNGRFRSEAVLESFSTDYDFLLDLDLNERDFDLYNSNASVSVNWENGIDAIASFDGFALPVADDGIEPCTLTGNVKLDFDFSSQKYKATSKNFHIDNMRHLPLDPSLSFSLDFEDGKVTLYDALIKTDEFAEMTGKASFDFINMDVAFVFRSDDELLQFSSTGIGDYYSALFSVTDYNLERLGFDDGIMNLSLVGRGRDINSLSFSGGFNVRGSDMINKPLEMSGEIYVNKDTLSVTDLVYKKSAMTVTCPDIHFSTTEGTLSIPLSLNILKENDDRTYPISLDLKLSMDMEGQKDFYKLFMALKEDNFETIDFGISLENFNLDNKFMIDRRSSTFSLDDMVIDFDGDLFDGHLNLDKKYVDLFIDLQPIGSFKLRGTFAPEFNLNAEVIDFNVSATNCLFVAPVVSFGPKSIADGSVLISGKLGDLHMFGDVWADRVDVNVLWVPDDDLIAHNVHFVIWDNNMKTPMTAVTAIDKFTQERREASVVCEFDFLPSFSFDHYQIDCYVPDGNEISFRLPLLQQNLDMKGKVSGYFQVRQEGLNDIYMEGKANADDFVVSIGIAPYPHWVRVNPDKKKEFVFDLLLRENFKFVYPLGPNPIITAFAAENQNIRLTFDEANGFGASGSVGLRAGEIYYFQKNFLITEGNLELRESETSAIDPLINLRAQLRDFDQNGDKVDIYLVLRDATLDNFNPTFESSPAKDISEIMSILGQSIISTENQGNLNSVVSLVSTGVDVLNRIGYLSMGSESDTFRKSIRTSLNLDTFSLHTNIIENLVFDAVGLVQNSNSRGISPLASYLDGTTLYMGKYLTTDIYLGAMVHLAADRSGGLDTTRKSFLTSDLTLDTEISIEWDNPLCNFRFFTRPTSINAFEIFDTMGFSLSRRFVF